MNLLVRPPLASLLLSCVLHGALALAFWQETAPTRSNSPIPVAILPAVSKPKPVKLPPVTRVVKSEQALKKAAPKVTQALSPRASASIQTPPAPMPIACSPEVCMADASPAALVAELAPIEAPPAVDSAEVTRAYVQTLTELIESRLEYPLLARKFRWEGRCFIRCQLARAGVIERVEVITPSEHDLLDKAAIRAIERIGSFPPVPETLAGAAVAIEVPITFRLQN